MPLLRSVVFLALVVHAGGAAATLDPTAIGAAVGVTATADASGVVRVAWPRDDVPVAVHGTRLAPAAGLTSWASFTTHSAGALLVGEVVLFEDEVTPAVDAALAAGMAVNGLSSRLAFERPRVVVLHADAQGEPIALATGLKTVWDAVRAVRSRAATPPDRLPGDRPLEGTLDAAALEKALGATVRTENGVAGAVVGRSITLHRTRMNAAQGVATWITFVGADAGAAVTGEIAAAAPEVQAVVRALRAGGLDVTGLHGHEVGETPTLYRVAFWGTGPAAALAGRLRGVLDAQQGAQR